MTDLNSELINHSSRRSFLLNSGMGIGASAFASLIGGAVNKVGANDDKLKPKAKRVIFLFMAGAPSQVDLFDYKPDMHKLFKTELPKSVSKGQRVTSMTRGREQLVAPTTVSYTHLRAHETV